MTRFEKVRAEVRRKLGEELSAQVDIVTSYIMARSYGMELHSKVNDATLQAIYGKIREPEAFDALWAAAILSGPCKLSQAIRDKLAKSVTSAVWKGESLARARRAFFDPTPRSIQHEVIAAYRRAIHDDGGPPTIAEVRREFLEENKRTRLPKPYPLRKMLTSTFGLPLRKGRVGRPPRQE